MIDTHIHGGTIHHHGIRRPRNCLDLMYFSQTLIAVHKSVPSATGSSILRNYFKVTEVTFHNLCDVAGMLRQYVQDHHHVAIQPRGLTNKGYWCYVNATLQALLACPPFYNLMHSIPNIPGLKKGKSSTPVIDSM